MDSVLKEGCVTWAPEGFHFLFIFLFASSMKGNKEVDQSLNEAHLKSVNKSIT